LKASSSKEKVHRTHSITQGNPTSHETLYSINGIMALNKPLRH